MIEGVIGKFKRLYDKISLMPIHLLLDHPFGYGLPATIGPRLGDYNELIDGCARHIVCILNDRVIDFVEVQVNAANQLIIGRDSCHAIDRFILGSKHLDDPNITYNNSTIMSNF